MQFWRVLTQAVIMTAMDRIGDIMGQLTPKAQPQVTPPASPWLASQFMAMKTIDGAVLFGRDPEAGAKFALPKGLPTEGRKTLAIENEPHTVDGFSGVIKSGYGKGTKTLLADESIVLKVKGKSQITRMNYHVHDADVAGLHYDLSIKDLPEGTEQFEINIPRGEFKGRFAFIRTPKGMIVTPMKDRSVLLPKPDYKLRDLNYLERVVGADPAGYVIERKVDGSLGNVYIGEERAVFRSHRESGAPYLDKLPGLEFLSNRSPFASLRKLDPQPNLKGTVLQVELIHQDGVARVSGILNAHPERAQATQSKRGVVTLQAWDILKLKGRDVSKLSAGRRRELLEETIDEIRRYNTNWDVVERYEGDDPLSFYQAVTVDTRGLPWSEGIVVKPIDEPAGGQWMKFKNRDYEDFIVLDILPSIGIGSKFESSAAVLVVRDPHSNAVGEVGSFAISDVERQWIWDHRHELQGAVAKILVMEKTAGGAPRAGVFHGWHGDPRFGGVGSEMALNMYADSLAGSDPNEAQRMLYALKSSAGWRKAA